MIGRVIHLHRPRPNSPVARLERSIALSVELRALLAPGFPVELESLAAAHERLAGIEVGMRSLLAVLTSGGPEAA